MLSIKLYVFLLCHLLIVFSIKAQRFDFYPRNNYRAFSGRAFGEGILRPGYDHGAGYFTESDAPSFSAPNADTTNYYG